MREFFRGWKRKVGVVTLLAGLLCSVGWVRSLVNSDALVLSVGKYKSHEEHGIFVYVVKSEASTLIVSRTRFESPDGDDIEDIATRYRYPQWESSDTDVVNPVFANVEWQLLGFGFCTFLSDGEVFEHHLLIPYWSIVLPPTLLSAWLLLSKSRRPLPMKTSDAKLVEVP